MPGPADCHIIEQRPEGSTEKPPILFVHGATGGAWMWEEHWLPAVVQRGWPAYALELRGHGNSPDHEKLHRLGLRAFTADVRAAMDRIGQPLIVVGHSMGGLLVQWALLKRQAVAAVLIAPVPPWGGTRIALGLIARDPRFLPALMTGSYKPLLEREQLFSDEMPQELAERYMRRLGPESRRAMLQLGRPYIPRRLDVPMLVVKPDVDRLIPPVLAERVAKFHRRAELVTASGVGHNPMLEPRWNESLDQVTNWLEKRVFA